MYLSYKDNISWITFGLGIGLIISALFFLFTPSAGELTDEEIINRAKQLGMVSLEQLGATSPSIEEGAVSSDQDATMEITIPAGANVNQIGELLLEAGVIESKENFTNLIELFNLETKLKAGSYELSKNIDLGDLLLTITGYK